MANTNMFQLGDTVTIGIRVAIDDFYYDEGEVTGTANFIVVECHNRVYYFDPETLRSTNHEARLFECKLTESDGGVSYWYWPVDIDEDDYKYFDDKVK